MPLPPPVTQAIFPAIAIRSVVRVPDYDRPGNLVVPALLAPVEGDPEESEKRREARYKVSEEAPDELACGRPLQTFGGDYPRLDRHFPGRGAAEAPEQYRRHGEADLHPNISQGCDRR